MRRPKELEEFLANNENKEVPYPIAFENVEYRLVCCIPAGSQSFFTCMWSISLLGDI